MLLCSGVFVEHSKRLSTDLFIFLAKVHYPNSGSRSLQISVAIFHLSPTCYMQTFISKSKETFWLKYALLALPTESTCEQASLWNISAKNPEIWMAKQVILHFHVFLALRRLSCCQYTLYPLVLWLGVEGGNTQEIRELSFNITKLSSQFTCEEIILISNFLHTCLSKCVFTSMPLVVSVVHILYLFFTILDSLVMAMWIIYIHETTRELKGGKGGTSHNLSIHCRLPNHNSATLILSPGHLVIS